jgi:hypothetical protein
MVIDGFCLWWHYDLPEIVEGGRTAETNLTCIYKRYSLTLIKVFFSYLARGREREKKKYPNSPLENPRDVFVDEDFLSDDALCEDVVVPCGPGCMCVCPPNSVLS